MGEHRNGPEHIEGKLTAGIGGQQIGQQRKDACLTHPVPEQQTEKQGGEVQKNPEGAAAAAGNLCKAVAACQTQAQRSTGQIVQIGKETGL